MTYFLLGALTGVALVLLILAFLMWGVRDFYDPLE
jgi:hypothetical protein